MYQSVALCCKKRHSLSHQSLEKRIQGFKWLVGKMKNQHNIAQKNVAGEEGDVSEITVSSWTERVKELTLNYVAPQDVWNMDESGAFWKALPERSLTEKRKRCRGGKQAKQRATVAFFVFQLQRPGCSQI